ncbi:Type II secretion system protein E [Rosistilla carotiformis]|uniref:Type II secretion system protein E n=2 Tax=Rosistilla carotiformis TaxID=2528017 RepID=A0A518JNJ2_9BACT|nr:Type II secretion system protein E [Rosistilla carotiformis]
MQITSFPARWTLQSPSHSHFSLISMAKQQEELQLWQTVAPCEFKGIHEDSGLAQGLLISARQSPGFPVLGGQLGHAIANRATHLMLDYNAQMVNMRYQIDGMWEQLPPLPRDAGDAMLVAAKTLCRMNPADRKNAQQGKTLAIMGRDKYNVKIQSQGVPTGERVMLTLDKKDIPFKTLDDLGMRDKMQVQLKEALNDKGHMVLISAPKGGGLTTSWTIALEAADKFISDFQAIEPKGSSEPDIINVSPNYFGPGAKNDTARDAVRALSLREPDVFVMPELYDDETIKLLHGQTKIEKQVISRIVASDAVEACARLVHNHRAVAKEIVEMLSHVTNVRLARRLCETCRQGFAPPPQLLQKLGIPQGRVAMMYQPFVPPPIEQQVDEKGNPAPIPPCPKCANRGYFGRFGIYELLTVGPKLKDALLKTGDVNKLRQVAKAEGHRNLQDEGIMAVARGITSLEEMRRIFSSGGK